MEKRKYYVYVYKDPITEVPFYVGKGTGNRCFTHLKETKHNTENYKKYCVIKGIVNKGLEPLVEKLYDNLLEEEAYKIEKLLIEKYGRRDLDENGVLTNICTDNRPPKPIITEEERERRRQRMLGNTYGHKWKGKSTPDWVRKRVSEGLIKNHPNRGKSMYDIWIKKYGEEEGDRRWKEAIEKRKASNRGFKHSDESREKMKIIQKGKNKGRLWITRILSSGNEYKFVFVEELENYISQGWIKGRRGFDPHN